MIDSNDIDKLFKDKLANRQFGFNPKSWDKMEKILDNEPSKKPWLYWFFGIGIAASLLYFAIKLAARLCLNAISFAAFLIKI